MGIKNKLIFWVLPIFLIILVGCTDTPDKPTNESDTTAPPDATLKLDKTQVFVQNGKLSEIITFTVTKDDKNKDYKKFSLKFPTQNKGAYVTNIEGSRVNKLNFSEELTEKDMFDTKQLKVYGGKCGGADTMTYTLNIELWSEDKQIKVDSTNVKVTVN